jgi:hypothetical protein
MSNMCCSTEKIFVKFEKISFMHELKKKPSPGNRTHDLAHHRSLPYKQAHASNFGLPAVPRLLAENHLAELTLGRHTVEFKDLWDFHLVERCVNALAKSACMIVTDSHFQQIRGQCYKNLLRP